MSEIKRYAYNCTEFVLYADHAAEVERLKAELEDIAESHRMVMNEQCPGDEIHCTCVPILKREIAALTKALEEALNVRIKLEGGSSQVVLNMVDGTWNFWDRHNSKNFEFSPASRALCERLFGGGK